MTEEQPAGGSTRRLTPRLSPLGDRSLLIRFANSLDEAANHAAVAIAQDLASADIPGVCEICPSLVSVLIRYEPRKITFDDLAARLRLEISTPHTARHTETVTHEIAVDFGGEGGGDLATVAAEAGLDVDEFVAAHNNSPLRVLATGFAPGFVYCGMHEHLPDIPRRKQLHARVPPGTVLFAAGQTAVTSTTVPTGWHVIGRTDFSNFEPLSDPPTRLQAGDRIRFVTRSVT